MLDSIRRGRRGAAPIRAGAQTLFDDSATKSVVIRCGPFAIKQDLIASKQKTCYQDRLDRGLPLYDIVNVLLQGRHCFDVLYRSSTEFGGLFQTNKCEVGHSTYRPVRFADSSYRVENRLERTVLESYADPFVSRWRSRSNLVERHVQKEVIGTSVFGVCKRRDTGRFRGVR
jgi:hypothetical protein